MKEKEREKDSGDGGNKVRGRVTIHGTPLGEISVPRGSRLSDVLDEIKRARPELTIQQFTVMLNDETIDWNKNGELVKNPVLAENFTLTLLKRFVGGTLAKIMNWVNVRIYLLSRNARQ